MELTQEQIQELRNLKNLPDSDDIRYKEIIKKALIDNDLIIYLLNNKELEEQEADPSDYLGQNIYPFFLVHPTQHNVQNFICFEISYKDVQRYNSNMKIQQIIFYILCEEKNNIEKLTGIARHDLLAAEIIHTFNWTNLFGPKIRLISDQPSVMDTDYSCRTLIFEQDTDNNLAKTYNGITRMNNREIYAKESKG